MRLRSIRAKNLGPFGDLFVDFEAVKGPLVAVVGENGAGKSTLLELAFPGAFYRETPTRGSLVDLATARDAMLESRVVNGKSWTLRHLVDGVSGKSEATALDETGAPAFDSSKVRDYDNWAAKHLPEPSVLYSSIFQPQDWGGFLAAKPSERKAILLRILGVEKLEAQAEFARAKARDARTELEVITARLADERARGGDVADVEIELEAARKQASADEGHLATARINLAGTEEALRGHRQRMAEAIARAEARLKLNGDIGIKRAALAELRTKLANNRAVLADATKIRDAEARLPALRSRLEAIELQKVQARADLTRFESEAATHTEGARAARARMDDISTRLRELEGVKGAETELPSFRKHVAELESQATEAEATYEAAQGQQVCGAKERTEILHGGLLEIDSLGPGPLSDAQEISTNTLDLYNKAVADAEEVPRKLVELFELRNRRREALATERGILSGLEKLAARAPELASARADLAAARQEAKVADEKRTGTLEAAAPLRLEVANLETEAKGVTVEITRLEPVAAKAGPLARAEARIAELEPQETAAAADLEQLERELAVLPSDGPPKEQEPDVAAAKRRVDDFESCVKESRGAVARAEQRLEQARASALRIGQLEVDRSLVEAELADWNRLADDLGRNGLQALEIDAAGPELTALANDLLRTCHGPRFTVRVDTQKLSADGKRLLEGCNVIVLDTKNGREAEGSTFSGGERAFIGEALSLALTMLASNRAGIEGCTLIRDESDSALTDENARPYVAMLRRAIDLMKADKMLIITHNKEIQEMADARIEIGAAA